MEKDDRHSEALSTLNAMRNRTSAHNKVFRSTSKDLSKALGSESVAGADIDTIWYRYFAQREAHNSDMLDLRFQLRDQLTRKEWMQVFRD